jgi:hypothetical protein
MTDRKSIVLQEYLLATVECLMISSNAKQERLELSNTSQHISLLFGGDI